MWIFNSLIIAIAMYSKIPMPQAEWNEKNMRYVREKLTLRGGDE